MADRYWVGGTGTWNTSSTTNWSASTGGASGASVPTVADSVFFDQAGTYTVTCTSALTCLDITVSAGTVTFANGAGPSLNVRGSMSLVAGTVWGNAITITFSSTTAGRTITTNGVALTTLNFSGSGGEWTFGSAFTTNSGFTFTAGTINTANYNVSCGGFVASTLTSKTLTLGSSTFTSTGNFNVTGATITVNAGTSTIIVAGSINTVGGGFTFYNLLYTSTSGGTRTISGANTFNNFTVTGSSSAGVTTVTFDSNQTINGTLSTTGTAGNRRVFFASATYGIGFTLTVNSAASLTDADFRDLYVKGTAAPISGTRIGNRGNCTGITFSTPKTVYWNLAAGGNWTDTAWATSSGGSVSTDNFPLPQDTATFVNTGLNASATVFTSNLFPYVSSVDMSARTSLMTLNINGSAQICYGNWTNGSGTLLATANIITFSGGGTQTITSAGKTFAQPITIDTYGGTVQLADALNIGSNNFTVTNGTFNTQGFAVTVNNFQSTNSNVRNIILGASTLSVNSSVGFGTSTNLTFNAGTSQINITGSGGVSINGGTGQTFYNVSFSGSLISLGFSSGANTFNNLTILGPSSNGISTFYFNANQTINGTLTCAGANAVRRVFIFSDTIGTQRTLTAAAISATDCDFRDIVLAGAAAGSSPTRAGDCGNNSSITFPASKTVYWNLAGTQPWSATAWCTASGGTPAVNNFPLAQDTAVFDNTGSAGTVTMNAAWNIGTFNASARTSAMNFNISIYSNPVYGNWQLGTGIVLGDSGSSLTFSKNGIQTITSNGNTFTFNVTINNPLATVQLADAFTIFSVLGTRTLTVTTGTFDAVTYNISIGAFSNVSTSNTLKMGSGTWTLSGTGTVWDCGSQPPALIVGTSTIVLSDTSTTARTFAGGGLYYNKLTIGGATGTSTLTITGNNTFGELASTKTVAHTIDFGSTFQTFGKWSVTGTVGNVVTITGTTTQNIIAGPAVTGVDYLAMGTWGIYQQVSMGEFYAGANSTGTAGDPVFRTAAPTPRTLYWVGGTGNWSATTSWSTSSGGASGAAIPTSLDSVTFDTASNATAYTATIDAGVTIARSAAFTMAGPLTGNVTFAGTVEIAFHGNVSFAATGITRSYTGAMNWAGNSSYTFTTNGLVFGSSSTVTGIGSTWTLGSAFSSPASFSINYGSFSTSASNYALTITVLSSGNSNIRSISLNGSTITSSGNPVSFSTTTNLTFNAGTSRISSTASGPTFIGGNQIFYNVSFTSAPATVIAITGAHTFNNLSFTGLTTVGIRSVTFSADQTINGTLTLGAGTAAAYRTFLASDTIGTPRTLTVNALAAGASDIDFRDIVVTGAAAPLTGTRFGDCKGNSGITFPAAKTVYYRQTASNSWGGVVSGSWSLTSGGAFDATAFPLAQDTAVFPAATYPASGSTTTINSSYNIGTIDMSLRTSNTMTLTLNTTIPAIYGNWINGTGITYGTGNQITFAGRGSQTITSVGVTFTQFFLINSPGGSVTLQDAFVNSNPGTFGLTLVNGTFNANGYNFTLSGSAAGINLAPANTGARTLAIGSGTWLLAGTTGLTAAGATNLTVTGTGTISLTSASAKLFAGGNFSYSGITLNQGGVGTLSITGNNTFANISKTAVGATTINFGTSSTTVGTFTAAGTASNLLTITGTSSASPATLIYSGSGVISSVDYVVPTFVRAYPTTSTWYVGSNSTNGGSLGFIFSPYPPINGQFFAFF